MAIPSLNWQLCDWDYVQTSGDNNEILNIEFTLPDSTAANQAVLTALQNLQSQVDQKVLVTHFGGVQVLAILNWIEIRQDPGTRPNIKLELEWTGDWSTAPDVL